MEKEDKPMPDPCLKCPEFRAGRRCNCLGKALYKKTISRDYAKAIIKEGADPDEEMARINPADN
jgi:hypothetical protein